MVATEYRLGGITEHFGSRVANDANWLDLARGEVFALLGEHGTGESTRARSSSATTSATGEGSRRAVRQTSMNYCRKEER